MAISTTRAAGDVLSLIGLGGAYVIDATLRQVRNASRALPNCHLPSVLMPSADKSVRIIERKQRELLPVEGKSVPFAKTERQIEREMAQTVASWVDERREVVKESGRSNSATGLLRLRSNLEREGG